MSKKLTVAPKVLATMEAYERLRRFNPSPTLGAIYRSDKEDLTKGEMKKLAKAYLKVVRKFEGKLSKLGVDYTPFTLHGASDEAEAAS
jgi:uncharacterized protein YdhG (YjbR/CyaY superfamily)